MIAHLPCLNEDMIYLIESLKVEGYWSSKSFTLTIQNKDIPFLNKIEDIIRKLKLIPHKRILVKIRLKDNTKKEDIKLYLNKEEIKSHIEKSPFDNNKVKVVTSLPYKKEHKLILWQRNKKTSINIKSFKDRIECQSKIDCWAYGDLRFPKRILLDFLDEHCRGNKDLHVENFLFQANEKLVMAAFSALIDCEGTVSWYGLKRHLQIRMRDKKYLKQWADLLEKHKVYAKFRRNRENWEISIYGWEDFNKLEKMGFRLFHSKKADKWTKMMNGFKRNQISRNSFRDFYIKKLKELNKKATAKELAEFTSKNKRTTNHFLLKLEKEGLVKCYRDVWPYTYSISK